MQQLPQYAHTEDSGVANYCQKETKVKTRQVGQDEPLQETRNHKKERRKTGRSETGSRVMGLWWLWSE
jgi:hypothetical protein